MKERFGAKDERSWKLRFHTQTAGVSLTAQQPYNNVVRTALQALSAVLGGTNSLHTNSLDEALALPTAEAATLALRTQQVIAHESGVTNMVDPLGGSWFVEKLTLDMEAGAYKYFETIDRMGGMVAAIENGFPPAGNRRGVVPLSAGGRGQGKAHRRRQRLRGRERDADVDSLHRRHRRRAAGTAARAGDGDTRSCARRGGARGAPRGRARRVEHDVSAPRLRPGIRDSRRNV
jgi:hypothetical protein